MPGIWKVTHKTFPYKEFAISYISCFLIMNMINTAYSLAFEDYCKRDSKIYNIKKRNA